MKGMNKRKVWKIQMALQTKETTSRSEDVERLAAVQQECYWDDRDVETWDAINWQNRLVGTINEKKIKKRKKKNKLRLNSKYANRCDCYGTRWIAIHRIWPYDSMDPETERYRYTFDPLENVTYDRTNRF